MAEKQEPHAGVMKVAEEGFRDATKTGYECGFDNALSLLEVAAVGNYEALRLVDVVKGMKATMMKGLFK